MPHKTPARGFYVIIATMQTKQTLIIANLKQNPNTLKEAVILARNYINLKKTSKNANIGMALPLPFLYPIQKEFGKSITIYAQSVSAYIYGPHTGETSAKQLISIGIKNTIIGHSERRAMGETNESIRDQVENALAENMNVILCVGEIQRHGDATHIHFVEQQLEIGLMKTKKQDFKNITIAYEPVWAIGEMATRSANVNEIYEMTIIIRKKLVEIFGKISGSSIKIIYGGSVNSTDCKEIMSVHHIEGLLVGHASLNTKEMKKIIDIARK